ncbi:hypothetical protein, partial [Nocardia seriolae]
MNSSSSTNSSTTPSRMRRLTARVAVAGALAAVPLAALAIPASAATTDNGAPAVSQIADPDWNHGRGDQDRGDRAGGNHDRGDQDRAHPGDRDQGPDQPRQQPFPLPPTG